MSNEDQAPDSEAQRAEVHDAEGTAGVATTSAALGDAQAATDQTSGADRDAQDSAPAIEATRGGLVSRDGVSRVLAMLALLVALAGAAASGFLFWQYRQFYVALDDADQGATQALQRVRIEQRSLRDEVAQLASEQAAANRELTAQKAEIGSLPPRFAELEERLTALQGVSADARRRWLRAEVEYLLGVANEELMLAGRFDNAVAALELADGKLRQLGNPRFTPVREAIANELELLGRVTLPDVEGLSLTIGSLARRAEAMPLASQPPDVYDPRSQQPEDLQPGLKRAWASLKSALKGMISIQRRDTPVSRQLSADDERLLRRALELELTSARLALLRGQGESYRQSLEAAGSYMTRYFDSADGQVVSAVALLDELADVDVDPPRPAISTSLNLLRQLASQQGIAQ